MFNLIGKDTIEQHEGKFGIRVPTPLGALLVDVSKSSARSFYDQYVLYGQGQFDQAVFHGEVLENFRGRRNILVLSVFPPEVALGHDQMRQKEEMEASRDS